MAKKETTLVVFTKSPSAKPWLLAYHEGEKAELPNSQAKELIEAGFAVKIDANESAE